MSKSEPIARNSLPPQSVQNSTCCSTIAKVMGITIVILLSGGISGVTAHLCSCDLTQSIAIGIGASSTATIIFLAVSRCKTQKPRTVVLPPKPPTTVEEPPIVIRETKMPPVIGLDGEIPQSEKQKQEDPPLPPPPPVWTPKAALAASSKSPEGRVDERMTLHQRLETKELLQSASEVYVDKVLGEYQTTPQGRKLQRELDLRHGDDGTTLRLQVIKLIEEGITTRFVKELLVLIADYFVVPSKSWFSLQILAKPHLSSEMSCPFTADFGLTDLSTIPLPVNDARAKEKPTLREVVRWEDSHQITNREEMNQPALTCTVTAFVPIHESNENTVVIPQITFKGPTYWDPNPVYVGHTHADHREVVVDMHSFDSEGRIGDSNRVVLKSERLDTIIPFEMPNATTDSGNFWSVTLNSQTMPVDQISFALTRLKKEIPRFYYEQELNGFNANGREEEAAAIKARNSKNKEEYDARYQTRGYSSGRPRTNLTLDDGKQLASKEYLKSSEARIQFAQGNMKRLDEDYGHQLYNGPLTITHTTVLLRINIVPVRAYPSNNLEGFTSRVQLLPGFGPFLPDEYFEEFENTHTAAMNHKGL